MEKEGFGTYLRQQRIQQGYTIADVESSIKIRGVYIEAIENEDFSQLPPRVFLVSFLRAERKRRGDVQTCRLPF